MKLKVNGSNERMHYPDLGGNLDQEEKKRFGIKVKKLSLAVHSDKWTKGYTGEDEGRFSIDLMKYVQSHVVGFVNPLMLSDGDKDLELTEKILFSDEYSELYPIIEGLLSYIQNMYDEDNGENIKK